jgi:hypothetical protein
VALSGRGELADLSIEHRDYRSEAYAIEPRPGESSSALLRPSYRSRSAEALDWGRQRGCQFREPVPDRRLSKRGQQGVEALGSRDPVRAVAGLVPHKSLAGKRPDADVRTVNEVDQDAGRRVSVPQRLKAGAEAFDLRQLHDPARERIRHDDGVGSDAQSRTKAAPRVDRHAHAERHSDEADRDAPTMSCQPGILSRHDGDRDADPHRNPECRLPGPETGNTARPARAPNPPSGGHVPMIVRRARLLRPGESDCAARRRVRHDSLMPEEPRAIFVFGEDPLPSVYTSLLVATCRDADSTPLTPRRELR